MNICSAEKMRIIAISYNVPMMAVPQHIVPPLEVARGVVPAQAGVIFHLLQLLRQHVVWLERIVTVLKKRGRHAAMGARAQAIQASVFVFSIGVLYIVECSIR